MDKKNKGGKQSPHVVRARKGSGNKGRKVASAGGRDRVPRIPRIPRTPTPYRKSTTIERWKAPIPALGRAVQLYEFTIGADQRPDNEIKLFYKGSSTGKVSAEPTQTTGIDLILYAWGYPDWIHLANVQSETPVTEIKLTDPNVFSNEDVFIAVVNNKIADPSANIDSEIQTEFIYLTIKEMAFVFDYEWENMPQGEEAAVVLDCSSEANTGDPLGIEVHSIGVNVISSK